LAAELVVGHLGIARLVVGARTDAVAESFASMPDDLLGAEPAVVLAAMALARRDLEVCTKHLARADETVDEGPAQRTVAIHLAIAVVQVLLSRCRADLDGATAAAAAADTLMADLEAEGVVPPAELRALVHWGRGGAELRAGHVAAAEASFATAARISDVAGCERLRLDCLGQLALIQAMCGRLRRAAAVVKMAVAAAEGCGLATAELPAAVHVALAWISTEECNVPAALAHAEQATAVTTIPDDPVVSAALALVRARLFRMRGELAAAGDALRAAHAGTSAPEWLSQTLVVAEASLAITAGRRHDAVRGGIDGTRTELPASATVLAWTTLERHDNALSIEHATEDLHNEGLPLDRRVDAWLLTAAGRLAQGRPQLAWAAVDQALRLAESEQLRRPILEAPPAVRRFMRQNAQLAEKHRWLSVGGTAAAKAHRPTTPAAPVLLQPLTEREQEVLRLLAALLSTEEIAKNMFISMNTVKTHVRGILRKLSAARRNEAVRRARDFGLI
jgi:LuxR family maltose regulon positive regulatory protein